MYRGFVTSVCDVIFYLFFFQAEDGIRDLVRSRGLGDVYKRQQVCRLSDLPRQRPNTEPETYSVRPEPFATGRGEPCLLYTSDAADERSSVDLGGRRIIKKKTTVKRPVRHVVE